MNKRKLNVAYNNHKRNLFNLLLNCDSNSELKERLSMLCIDISFEYNLNRQEYNKLNVIFKTKINQITRKCYNTL